MPPHPLRKSQNLSGWLGPIARHGPFERKRTLLASILSMLQGTPVGWWGSCVEETRVKFVLTVSDAGERVCSNRFHPQLHTQEYCWADRGTKSRVDGLDEAIYPAAGEIMLPEE